MSAVDDPFEGLDSAEREILEREIREGRYKLPQAPAKGVEQKPVGSGFADMRDKRDPASYGKTLLHMSEIRPDLRYSPLSEAQDMHTRMKLTVAEYEADSLGEETVRARTAELETRAAQGDKYAISMLTTGLPGDSDA